MWIFFEGKDNVEFQKFQRQLIFAVILHISDPKALVCTLEIREEDRRV